MKKNTSLTLFSALILFFATTSSIQAAYTKTELSSPIKGYFYVQRLYPGLDPLSNIKLSEYNMQYKYFELNKNMLFFAKNKKTIEDIQGKINYFYHRFTYSN